MDTTKLKKFAQYARRNLIEQVQSKLKLVLADGSAARREHPKAVKELEQKLNHFSNKKEAEEQLIEQVAYTWFNRFCALRFMDINQYNRIMVLSPISGQFQPEILAEAKAGYLDDSVFNDKAREKIQGLLSGSTPSRDGQSEAYRVMIVAVCNDYHRLMPFLFQRIEDYTELLMPDDLLSGNSIIAYTREAMMPENCESVESIGWLYQFYISEKKEQVFNVLKKKNKITPENIPAATQLFTPHWIVKYLVENSLGRLWMLNSPRSKVIEQMEYYIKPVEDETQFLKVNSPEELKICDPACGSGHMLTYAYDLLYAIYLDANYDPSNIPELILTKNLYGIEIDERAAELAAFALSMKALKGNPNDDGNHRRRFFRKPIKPNISHVEKVKIDDDALDEYMEFIGLDLFTQDLRTTLKEFEEADNFGSLIQPTLKSIDDVLAIIEDKDTQVDIFLSDIHKSVLKILKQADYLTPKYHVVIANPPYMGLKGMNPRLATWLSQEYTPFKADLFSAFIYRCNSLCIPGAHLGLMTPNVWMYISSHRKIREHLINSAHISSLVELPLSGFKGATVQICFFTFIKARGIDKKANFIRLISFKGDDDYLSLKTINAINSTNCNYSFSTNPNDFKLLPNNQFAYWENSNIISSFSKYPNMEEFCHSFQGIITGNNEYHLRSWYEISSRGISWSFTNYEESKGIETWVPYNKGGSFRRWAGNSEHVLRWNGYGDNLTRGRVENREYFFRKGLTWSDITSYKSSFREQDTGMLFDAKGPSAIFDDSEHLAFIGLMNSIYAEKLISILNPTLSFQIDDFYKIPINHDLLNHKIFLRNVERCIAISKEDWDSSEQSWNFKMSPLLSMIDLDKSVISLKAAFTMLQKYWEDMTVELKTLEEENNLIVNKVYDLDNYLPHEVNKADVTLNRNPYYKFRGTENAIKKLNTELAMELIQYSVGAIFGRYSLDKEGRVLANQGDTIENYLEQIPSPSFIPDDDNVIPIIDFELEKDKGEYWFEDDISERFKVFLKVTFGEDHFTQNLLFIEEVIGKDIKKYFVKDFYVDHVKRYKKRPIYWMFSSSKGSFNALIYMHRYQPDTVSIVLNDYLREFRTKLEARKESYEQVEISVSASQKDITQAIKAIAKINKVLEEVNDYEHDVLYPLAGKNIEIDLDDGVKHNYPLFGKALKKVTGLS